MDKKAAIADTIKQILEDRGIKRKEFAELMGIPPSCITKWLSGVHNFTLETIFEIEKQLNCSIIAVQKPSVPIIWKTKVYSGNFGTI
jgi:predicted transcriptional regulator